MPDWSFILGPFGVLVVLVLLGIAGAAGKWRFGREFDSMVTEKDKQLAEKEKLLDLMTVDRDDWKTMTLGLLQQGDRQATATATIASATAAITKRRAT